MWQCSAALRDFDKSGKAHSEQMLSAGSGMPDYRLGRCDGHHENGRLEAQKKSNGLHLFH
jgi:hypothetical protein